MPGTDGADDGSFIMGFLPSGKLSFKEGKSPEKIDKYHRCKIKELVL